MFWFFIGLIVTVVFIGLVLFAISLSGGKGKSNREDRDNYNQFINTTNYNGPHLTYEEYKGYAAERSITIILEWLAEELEGTKAISNVTIPSGKDKNGKQRTIEIDHIFFTRSGLFVIETKSRAGKIYGTEEDDEWYQVLGQYDEIQHNFYNPIKQNATHIRVLQRLLRLDNLKCYSLVVFEDGDISNIESDIVIKPSKLEMRIKKEMNETIYSQQDIDGFYTRIKYYKEHPPATKEEHIKNVHSRDYDA